MFRSLYCVIFDEDEEELWADRPGLLHKYYLTRALGRAVHFAQVFVLLIRPNQSKQINKEI
jgi:hypothetical protein